MDQSNSDVDISISPSRILYRLQELRKMQLLQQERLLHQHDTVAANNVDDLQFILNQFSSDSTTYNTFHQLLFEEASRPASSLSHEECLDTSAYTSNQRKSFSREIKTNELVDGVAPLNLSKESEPHLTPITLSTGSEQTNHTHSYISCNDRDRKNTYRLKKHIELDDMPILTPKRDFETLVLEKMKSEKQVEPKKIENCKSVAKKPFLRRGVGLARFGMTQNDVFKPNRVLPWKRNKKKKTLFNQQSVKQITRQTSYEHSQSISVSSENIVTSNQETIENTNRNSPKHNQPIPKVNFISPPTPTNKRSPIPPNLGHTNRLSKSKSPKTWATVLTQEQEIFLQQLKQTAYYKSFHSPAKSVASDTSSITDSFYHVSAEKELAEQNLFELLERKVSNASFCSNSSFFSKFINNNNYSGNSTPLATQNFLASHPQVLNLHPMPLPEMNFTQDPCMETDDERITNDETCYSQNGQPQISCESEEETCSSVSCYTCQKVDTTVETTPQTRKHSNNLNTQFSQASDSTMLAENNVNCSKKNEKKSILECQHNDSNITQINKEMAEMNAKLVATSEMLKDRLQELEGEIDVFRNENAELAKMREGLDLEKHKFFEEKATFEQKFNEEKILSEYYIAEEKEKLAKQKNIYDKYVRDLKGKLNKKEREEVIQLKKEIEELKEQMRTKDAKSTSCIARLRNQVKSLEKENANSKDECEKLKKENRKIQFTNTTTRRLSNIKYLAELNNKLGNCEIIDHPVPITQTKPSRLSTGTLSKDTKTKQSNKINLRARTRSVPNLTVTSSYAKYFSQRDIHTDRVSLEGKSDSTDEEEYIETYRRSDEVYSPELMPWQDNQGEKGYGDCIPSYHRSDKLSDGESSNHEKTEIPRLSNDTVNEDLERMYFDTFPENNKNYKSDSYTPRTYSISSERSSKSNNERDLSGPQILENNLGSVTRTRINPQEISRKDGSKELRFPNGNIKLISSDGKYTRFVYYNGDVKETFFDQGSIKYFFAETKTYHTTYKDGLEVLEFPDGQIEKRHKDGSIEIHLPNGSIRYSNPKNKGVKEEWRFPDGTVVSVGHNDEQTIRFPNGQVEIHTKEHKRRQFPDGTVKTVYADGTSETRFASGRIRVKDKHGNVLMDKGT